MSTSSRQKKILVCGATGNQGSGVVQHCLKAGQAVFALVRDVTSTSAQKLQDSGATLVEGNFDDVESLQRATATVDAVFFTATYTLGSETDLRHANNIIAAARQSDTVSTIIYTGSASMDRILAHPMFGPEYSEYEYWTTKRRLETLVRESGIANWVIVRPAWFMQNFLPPISDFVFPGLADKRVMPVAWKPETRVEMVDGSEVGVVAAAAVADVEKYSGRVIELAAEALTLDEVAEVLSKVSGSQVKVDYMNPKQLMSLLGPYGGHVAEHQVMHNELGHFIDLEKTNREFKLTGFEEFLQRALH
ncbi:NAD dependent epimerase/dehydratase [Annulohypoxylon truncatum]|uniref:NAD dependent epimerase/dehydratase n=1 Tax=Annulohypoxylon truncatum TaxID=327061 RepID=UPI002007ECD0|nr:NAD dependent epimerase/dehydratase [Annulohypoxylon truncatum]KAI1205735.1 NAD dependent epimerase/dehydratase [Annulohypoxylon truncatum]